MVELSDGELEKIEHCLTENLDHLLALGYIAEINAISDNEENFSLHFPAEKSDDDMIKEYLSLIPED